MHEFPALFHVESNRLEGRIEHAGVGGEQQPAGLAFQSARQSGKIRIGSSVRPLPIEPDHVLAQINLADSVRVTLILHGAARSGVGQGAVAMGGKACCRRQKENNRSRFAHFALLSVSRSMPLAPVSIQRQPLSVGF